MYKEYTVLASAIFAVRLMVQRMYCARNLSSYGFPGYKYTYYTHVFCPYIVKGHHFEESQTGMRNRLKQLRALLNVADPQFYQFLSECVSV